MVGNHNTTLSKYSTANRSAALNMFFNLNCVTINNKMYLKYQK